MEIAVTYPLEYVKTNVQLQHGAYARTGLQRQLYPLLPPNDKNKWLEGPLQRLRAVVRVRRVGRRCASLPLNFCRRRPQDAWFRPVVGAGTARQPFCQTPNQSIQIKLLHDASPAVAEKRYSHLPFFRACAAIGRHHGILSFYDGLAPAVAKGALTNCVRFVGYKGILRLPEENNASAMESFGAGAVAGAISAVISQFVDTVKANMMGLDRAYTSSLDRARAIVKADGVRLYGTAAGRASCASSSRWACSSRSWGRSQPVDGQCAVALATNRAALREARLPRWRCPW